MAFLQHIGPQAGLAFGVTAALAWMGLVFGPSKLLQAWSAGPPPATWGGTMVYNLLYTPEIRYIIYCTGAAEGRPGRPDLAAFCEAEPWRNQ
jgi:hypothetical protein